MIQWEVNGSIWRIIEADIDTLQFGIRQFTRPNNDKSTLKQFFDK